MSLRRYACYKQSGIPWIDVLPDRWDVYRIKRLFEIKKRISGSDGHPVLSITQQGIKVKDTESGDGQLSMDYSKYQFVEVGDFAMNHMDLLTGYVDISSVFGVTSPDYRVFTIRDTSRCFDRYYLYLFQMGYKNRIFFAFGQGSSQLGRWRFPTDQFNDFQIPCPPLNEQKQIAAFLDRELTKIDELVVEMYKVIDLLKEKRNAAITHVVTKGLNANVPLKDSGIGWIGRIPSHWEVRRIKSVSSFITSGPRGWSERIGENGALFIQSGDLDDLLQVDFASAKRVQVNMDAETNRTRLNSGDVVVCITGAKTGNVAVCSTVPETAYINQHLCLIRPNGLVSSAFLGIFLKSAVGQTYFEISQYGLKQGLSLDNVREVPVLLPPVDEQALLVEFLKKELEKYDALASESERTIALLQTRRTALIAAAVTGNIDVRDLSALHSGREAAA